MLVVARAVPKARCEDSIKTAIVTGEDKDKLVKARANLQHLGILLPTRTLKSNSSNFSVLTSLGLWVALSGSIANAWMERNTVS